MAVIGWDKFWIIYVILELNWTDSVKDTTQRLSPFQQGFLKAKVKGISVVGKLYSLEFNLLLKLSYFGILIHKYKLLVL
jgi:hypothetical protein